MHEALADVVQDREEKQLQDQPLPDAMKEEELPQRLEHRALDLMSTGQLPSLSVGEETDGGAGGEGPGEGEGAGELADPILHVVRALKFVPKHVHVPTPLVVEVE